MKTESTFKTWKRPLIRVFSNRRPLVLLFILGLLFFALLEWIQPFYFTHDDNIMHQLPSHIFNYRSILETNRLPFINFHQYLGHPHFSAGQTSVLYLPAYLSSLLADKLFGTLAVTVDVGCILHLLAALFAIYAYLRILKVSIDICCYGALLYVTTPFLLNFCKAEIVVSYCAFYIPILFGCLEAFFSTRSVRYLLFLSLFKALFFFQGNIQFVFMYQTLELAYFICKWLQTSSDRRAGMIRSWLCSNILTAILVLPLFIPMMHASLVSQRGPVLSIFQLLYRSVNPAEWIASQFYVFSPNVLWYASSAIFHLGGFFLLITLLPRLRFCQFSHSKRWLAPLLLLVASLLLMTWLYIILAWLPPFNNIRWPYKWYPFCIFGYAVFTSLLLYSLRSKKILSPIWVPLFFLLAIASNLSVTLSPEGQTTIGKMHLNSIAARRFSTPSLPQNTGRSLTYGVSKVNSYEGLFDLSIFNYATLWGQDAFGGYDPIVPAQTHQVVQLDNYHEIEPRPLTQKRLDHLSDWSVQTIIAMDTPDIMAELQSLKGLSFQSRTKSGFLVFSNTQSKPYARFDDDPMTPLPIRFKVNSVEIESRGHSGNLIVSLVNLPGWSYSLDGTDLGPPAEALSGQMKISVPPGFHFIQLKYSPPFFQQSTLASVALLFLFIPAWIFVEKRKSITNQKSVAELLATSLQKTYQKSFLHRRIESLTSSVPDSSCLRNFNRFLILAWCLSVILLLHYLYGVRNWREIRSEIPKEPILFKLQSELPAKS